MKNKIIFLLIVVVLFNGLNNSRELNDIAIVSSIAIDLDEEDNYIASAQVLNTKKTGGLSSGGSSSDGAIINVYSNKAESIQEAIRNMVDESPKKLYLAHMKLLILSEKVAKNNDILDTLDFFIRDNEGSNKFILAIAKDCSPKDLISQLTPIQTMPSQNIISSIAITNKYEGISSDNRFSDNLKIMLEEGIEPVFVSLSLSGDIEEGKSEDSLKQTSPASNIKIDDLAYFKSGKMIGYLNQNDNMVYNLMENKINNAIIRVGQNEERIVAEIIKSSCKMTPKLENSKLCVDIKVDLECNITEIGQSKNLNNKENINDANEKIKDEVKKYISKYIYDCQHVYKSDIIGFGNLFYKHLNKEYKKIKEEFEKKYFPNIQVNIDVNSKLPDEGGIKKI